MLRSVTLPHPRYAKSCCGFLLCQLFLWTIWNNYVYCNVNHFGEINTFARSNQHTIKVFTETLRTFSLIIIYRMALGTELHYRKIIIRTKRYHRREARKKQENNEPKRCQKSSNKPQYRINFQSIYAFIVYLYGALKEKVFLRRLNFNKSILLVGVFFLLLFQCVCVRVCVK